MTVIECATSQEAIDLLHYCLSDGEVRLTKHFREELQKDDLSVEDVFAVLRGGTIYEPPELDIKTREWKWRVEGREPNGKWIARERAEMVERAEWECSSCGAPAKVVRGKYRFSESGLPDVSLVGVKLIKCSKCRNVDPVIENMKGLMQVLALAVIEKPWKLSGAEIRYLRKYLGMTAEQFADHVGVDKTTISKWENNHDSVGDPSDRLIRALALTMGDGLRESIDGIVRRFPNITSALKECGYKIDNDTQRVEYV